MGIFHVLYFKFVTSITNKGCGGGLTKNHTDRTSINIGTRITYFYRSNEALPAGILKIKQGIFIIIYYIIYYIIY